MIREIVKDIDGNDVILLRPESAADVDEINRLVKQGKVDPGESMGDRDDSDEQDLIDAGILPDE